ncbi:GPI inositol-deacylase PGAP1-like protein, partial [Dichotomocladium elegans]
LLGVPGLFIPGHAGSYKQVRSIAAETAEQYGPAAIDYFTVDLNEEFSALSGQQLLQQAEFLNDAIHHILSELYQDRYSAVIIVGHSMGGIVARLMSSMANYRPKSVHHILTLATPHAQQPIALDPVMTRVYATVHRRYHSHPNETTLISIAGGTADTIVNSDMAHQGADVTAFSSGIPGVWTSCDHMAILWCNQL